MKRFLPLLLILAGLLVGYVAGNFFPLSRLGFVLTRSIKGNAKLQVKLVNEAGKPLSKIEVDIGQKMGPPPDGGRIITDENGIVTFNILPGNYFIYFNGASFPKNLVNPYDGHKEVIQIQVEENKLNEKTIILKTK